VRDEKKFIFGKDVNVYPDGDNQKLGLESNRWKEVYAVNVSARALKLSALQTPPPGVSTVDLVLDPQTGTIYRKS
jgi:hypothetical protein